MTPEAIALIAEYADAAATQEQARREYDATRRLLKSAMEAANLASLNRLRAAANIDNVVNRMRAEGIEIPLVPAKAAA